jgi:hypothetical protein
VEVSSMSSGDSSPRTSSGRVHRVPAQVLQVPPLQIASAMSSSDRGGGSNDTSPTSCSPRRHMATPQAWNCDEVHGRDLDGRERRKTRHAESTPSPLRSNSQRYIYCMVYLSGYAYCIMSLYPDVGKCVPLQTHAEVHRELGGLLSTSAPRGKYIPHSDHL